MSTESAIIGLPIDIALDEHGQLYVLDVQAAQVLVLSPDGEILGTIGREGSGPREFRNPDSFTLTADTLRVVDRGNGRLQTLALRGESTRNALLPVASSMGAIAVSDDGRFLTTTFGLYGVLAEYQDPTGRQLRTLGSAIAPVSGILDPRGVKQEIVDGVVPAMFRNAVLPVFAPNGDMWLVLTGEGQLQRFDEAGSLQVSVPLEAPEMEQVWEECVERAKATLDHPSSIPRLSYAWDAAVVGETLWVLLNTTRDGPAVLMAFADDGQVKRRVLFSNVLGAQSFALDRERTKIFFAVPSDASIVASSLPNGVFEP